MTTTTTIAVLGILSAFGFTAAVRLPQVAGDVPWKDIAGGGAALMLMAALWMFLRFLSDERKARAEEREADREHLERMVGQFTSTSLQTQRESLQSRDRNEEALRTLVRDTRKET